VDLGLAVHDADGSVVFLQREEVGSSPAAPAPEPPPTPAPGAAAPAADAAPAAGLAGAGGTTDLDELARQLYERIRWRLRTELRLDLERSGLGAGVGR
jgi:hypothetical protein